MHEDAAMHYSERRDAVVQLTTGPVSAYPAVLRALSRPVTYDGDPVFQRAYERVIDKLQAAFRSRDRPVILPGEPVLGLEAAAASLIGRDDVVLNLASGVYGKGYAGWARRYAREVIELDVPFDEAISPEQVADALRRRPDISVVAVCHHDTPSGTLNPVDAIGRLVAHHGGYLIVDAVSSFGGMDVHPDGCRADLFVTGANKCLGCPPALTLLGVSARAWSRMAANPGAPRASALSLLDWQEAWQPGRPFPSTPFVAEVHGLEAALDGYLEEGAEEVWARHALTAAACRAGMVAMGLRLWPATEEIASPTATAVRTPEGLDEAQVRATARGLYGVVLSGGRGATAGKLTRVGHMGPSAQPLFAVLAVAALGGALQALGHPADVGSGTAAALAVINRSAGMPMTTGGAASAQMAI